MESTTGEWAEASGGSVDVHIQHECIAFGVEIFMRLFDPFGYFIATIGSLVCLT